MENLNYVIHLFHSGGYVMYPLLLLSFMVIAIATERAFYYRKYASKTFVVTHAVNELAKLQNWAEIDKVIKETHLLRAVLQKQVYIMLLARKL